MNGEARSEVFREVNERIAEIASRWEWEDTQGFLCECTQSGCTRSVLLTRAQYESVRVNGGAFFTAPGHEHAGKEQIVERQDGFVVVQKLGLYQQEAQLDDPRRDAEQTGTGSTTA